ncbi:MAG: hypothetical protein UT32_C0021G0012 [Parcubacteria group bacterium GW2011_GWC2_39_14]|nr:MAG: hypothetical protein UT32_C0021G0012 [Parcubacteria group bacterium GW2011_GWC2_39_14]KKR53945.1 MAG: hypothetical protein UT91_C0022G0012 [Parcubacteria group bacterium GW2011_GWA2_40_23]
MPRAHEAALLLLMRHTKLSQADWIELIKLRLTHIKPWLKDMPMMRFDEVEILQDQSHLHRLGRLHDKPAPELLGFTVKYGLTVQGLFDVEPLYLKTIVRTRGERPYRHVVGILRTGRLVLIKVTFVDEQGYKGRGYQRALTVELRDTTVEEILTIQGYTDPKSFWTFLNDQIKAFFNRRQKMLEDAGDLYREMIQETKLLSVLELDLIQHDHEKV